MSSPRTTIFVCVTCRVPIEGDEGSFRRPGEALADALEGRLNGARATGIDVRPVECLSVCNRPCTIAFAGENKWTYVFGGLDAEAHLSDIVAAAVRYAAAEDGIIPWKERPLSFRKGVVARVPPETYRLTRNAE